MVCSGGTASARRPSTKESQRQCQPFSSEPGPPADPHRSPRLRHTQRLPLPCPDQSLLLHTRRLAPAEPSSPADAKLLPRSLHAQWRELTGPCRCSEVRLSQSVALSPLGLHGSVA